MGKPTGNRAASLAFKYAANLKSLVYTGESISPGWSSGLGPGAGQ